MNRAAHGFSLIELLVALTVTLGLGMMTFQLFHQNERVIRDQTLIMEMQQTARIVASQIADEIRMAGQGVPLYATSFDTTPSEAVAVILGSSNVGRVDFRAGLSNVETVAAGSGPSDFSLGVSRSISVTNSSGFSVGKFVYIAGPGTDPKWAWIRAELTGVAATALTLIPRDTGTTDTTIHFSAPPAVVLEEANSIYLSSSSVRRATATDTSNAASPVWSPANEIGRNFSALTFAYYDMYGNAVQPASLSNRMAIARVDIQLTVRAATALSNGTRPTYSLALRTIPRNMRAHLSQ